MSWISKFFVKPQVELEFTNYFTRPVSALECAEPIVGVEGTFERESRIDGEERGSIAVEVMVVRQDAQTAEADALACERLLCGDWEPYAECGPYRVVGVNTTAPALKEVDSSGRFVWAFTVTVTAVREI